MTRVSIFILGLSGILFVAAQIVHGCFDVEQGTWLTKVSIWVAYAGFLSEGVVLLYRARPLQKLQGLFGRV